MYIESSFDDFSMPSIMKPNSQLPMKKLLGVLVALWSFLPLSNISAKSSDSVSDEDASIQFYISPRKLKFSPLGNGDQIHALSLDTQEVGSGYSTDKKYVTTKDSTSHSLTAIGARGRFQSDPDNTLTAMTNVEVDLLLDFSFDYLQARSYFDFGVSWHPISFLRVGPALGIAYSYFGSSIMISSQPDYSASVGSKDDAYALRDGKTGKDYLFTIGPHNFTGYFGVYVDFTMLGFLDISGIAHSYIMDIPLASNGVMNDLLGSSKSIASKRRGSWNSLDAFMLDIRGTLYLNKLGMGFDMPLIVGYKKVLFSSLGLTETGLYFGVVFRA